MFKVPNFILDGVVYHIYSLIRANKFPDVLYVTPPPPPPSPPPPPTTTTTTTTTTKFVHVAFACLHDEVIVCLWWLACPLGPLLRWCQVIYRSSHSTSSLSTKEDESFNPEQINTI